MSDDVSKEVLALRASRAEMDAVKKELEGARAEQVELEEKIERLLKKQRTVRAGRNDAVRAADAAGIPRLRISKEVGMQRSNVYKLLDDDAADES